MLTLDTVDFVENLNSQLMRLTQHLLDSTIQKIVSAALFQDQPGEIFIFVLRFLFAHMNILPFPSCINLASYLLFNLCLSRPQSKASQGPLDNVRELKQIYETQTNCHYVLHVDGIVYLGPGCKT